MKYLQDPPFCIDIEASEGCNLECAFCGIQAIRPGPGGFKFMTVKTITALCESVAAAGWTSRMEISGHGEPTMNPNLKDLVATIRRYLPKNQILVTSNGGGLLKDPTTQIAELFEVGANIIILDNYEHVNIVPKIIDRYKGDVPLTYYPQDGLEHSPYRRRPRGTRMLVVVQDISTATTGSHASPNNRSGQAAPQTRSKDGKRCVKPFRDLVVRWDGNVNSCCNDYRGIYKIANVNTTPAHVLWNGPEFAALRKYLYHGMRVFPPCQGCDFVGMRVGLLPDKLGKKTLPKPNAADAEIVANAVAGKSFTKPVKRPWEK